MNLFAEKIAALDKAATEGMATAQAAMMDELRRDYGDQTPVLINKARQGAELVATKAGLTPDHLTAISQVLSEKAGDASVIKFMAAIADMAGEDAMIGGGKGGPLTMTPAEARAQYAAFTAPDGEWAKAAAEGNAAKIAELRPKFMALAKLAAG